MTPQFITLPSGLRVNTAHILEYRSIGENRVLIIQSSFEDINGMYPKIEEDMTAEQLDALLNPPSSPIVESAVNLDRLMKGSGCYFKQEGRDRHGIIESFGVGETSGKPFAIIESDGEYFTHWLHNGRTEWTELAPE